MKKRGYPIHIGHSPRLLGSYTIGFMYPRSSSISRLTHYQIVFRFKVFNGASDNTIDIGGVAMDTPFESASDTQLGGYLLVIDIIAQERFEYLIEPVHRFRT